MAIRRLGGIILGLALSTASQAAPPATAVIGTPPQPAWHQLDAGQHSILAPLAKDWDGMENIRRKKWLGIAERYPKLHRDEQRRLQERMHEWAALSPEERKRARDSYKDFKQLPPERKAVVKQKWEAYKNLPADEQQRLRQDGKSSRLLAPNAGNDTPAPTGQEGNKLQ